ncbi:hypothetical protein HDV02_005326 [Globomyces sp. JEL0801]|nr:hypothetical protein HDV02_005326 [Globomyces sp. JEL0801]
MNRLLRKPVFSSLAGKNTIFKKLFHSNLPLFAVTPFKLADIGEGISEVEIIQWFVKPGDRVEEFSKICEVQSDKAAVEISSRYDGVILKLHHEAGGIAKVGAPLVDIETENTDEEVEESSAPEESKESPIESEPITHSNSEAVENSLTFATPAVRRIAKEHQIDISKVVGTGPQNRVLKGDVLAFIKGDNVASPNTASVQPPAPTVGDKSVQLTPIQKAMFKSMTKSLTIPHFGFSDEITVNATSKFRKELNQYLKSLPKGTWAVEKITFMPIFLKALSQALKEYPILNAKIVNPEQSPTLLYRGFHNIGVAMDTPQGLVVPNVKDVQNKSIFEIAADLESLKLKAQKGALTNADLQGGTFTLSNVGNIGGTALHPVLVSTEVCIGAVGRIQRLPRFESINGVETVVAAEVLNVSFNADHRVIDGATVARFVQLWKQLLEHPALLSATLK